jgi:HEAT repeat protein
MLQRLALSLALVLTSGVLAVTQPGRRLLTAADIDAITTLVMLEDTRQFDEAALSRLMKSAHPEVRRRAVIAVGRIVNPAGTALLASARNEDDVEILATVAFATGQLKDPDAVTWLSGC